jgi:uncharacterized protein
VIGNLLIRDRVGVRFEGVLDGEVVAWADYRRVGSRIIIRHTEVERERRGSGVGTRFTEGVLEHLTNEGQTLTNYCPFVTRFLEAHPRYQVLVDSSHPGAWPPSAAAGG